MTVIEVTSPQASDAARLALQTCASCGRHVWVRDGEVLDRATVLGAVRDRIAEAPTARVPRPRAPRAAKAPSRVDLVERLAAFTVHG